MTEFSDLGNLDYFTKRNLENKKGELTGKIIVFRTKGEQEHQVKLKCPECGNVEDQRKLFTRRPFRVSCSKCGESFAISRLSKKEKE